MGLSRDADLNELRRQVQKLEERAKWLEAKMKYWEHYMRGLVGLSQKPPKPR